MNPGINITLYLMLLIVNFPAQADEKSINWLAWQDQSFQLAKEQNKLILLDVGTEWCSACNQMHHETYTDPTVQKLLKEHFITIHVDAEAEPDLGERYGFWGWPALIFIKPDGEHVGFFRGARNASGFIQMLTNFQQAFISGELTAPNIEVDLISRPAEDDFSQLVNLGNRMLDRFYDDEHHGWGGSRMANPYLLQQAWWRGIDKDSADWSKKALNTSRLYLNMIDPVWGGIWFGSRSPNFERDFIHERRTEHQAGALIIFAEAYLQDRNPTWLSAINNIARYLDEFMLHADGGYYTSQEMHLYAGDKDVTPERYFELDDKARRSIGLPDIDTTFYTDINAKLVIAFAKVYQATADKHWKQRALELMNYLIQSSDGKGGYIQIINHPESSNRIRQLTAQGPQLFLRTQAFAGLAALSSFEISGDSEYLKKAHMISEVIIRQLLDTSSGGMLASNRKTRAPDGKPLRDQPLVDTGAAAELFNRLAALSYGAYDRLGSYSSKDYRPFSESALRAVASAERVRVQGYFIAQYVLALHQWQDDFIQVSVVCRDISSKQCSALHTRVLSDLYHPRRVIKLQSPGYYPDTSEATLFICNAALCSSPIAADDDALKQKVVDWYQRLASL